MKDEFHPLTEWICPFFARIHRGTGECFQESDHGVYRGLIEIQVLSDAIRSQAGIESGVSGCEVDLSVMSDRCLQGSDRTGVHHGSVRYTCWAS